MLLWWQTISKQKIITALFKSKQKVFFAPHRSDFSSVLKQFLRSTQFWVVRETIFSPAKIYYDKIAYRLLTQAERITARATRQKQTPSTPLL